MKALATFILLFMPVPKLLTGQQFKQAVFLAPGISYFSSPNQTAYPEGFNKNRFGNQNLSFSFGYRAELAFPNSISIGTGVDYLLSKSKITEHYVPHSLWRFDPSMFYVHNLSMNSLEFPVSFKIRNKRSQYAYMQVSSGLSCMLFTKARVYQESRDGKGNEVFTSTEVHRGNVKISNNAGNNFGTFYSIDIGKVFQYKNHNLFIELTYRQDFNYWKYTSVSEHEYALKRHGLMLKTGLYLLFYF